MKITYIYHSGFLVETTGFDMVFDYWQDPANVMKTALTQTNKPLYVFASHGHGDHFNHEVLAWSAKCPCTFIFSNDIRASGENIVSLGKGGSFSDENIKVWAFGSTDAGISFLVKTRHRNVFHAGDFNCWHWSDISTPYEIKIAEVAFKQELDYIVQKFPKIDVSSIDVAFFPVDARLGSDYDRGARQFVEAVKIDTLIPMHFTANSPKTVTDFADESEKYVKHYAPLLNSGDEISIDTK